METMNMMIANVSWGGVLSAVVIIGLGYYVASSIYCIFFHPFSSYPGPFWAKFSHLPSFYHTLRSNRHLWIQDCHARYGSCFRSQPHTVLFNTPSAQRAIYGVGANVRKGKFYAVWTRKADAINTWASRDRDAHARKRRILNAAFSDRALRSSEVWVREHVSRWSDLLLEGSGNEKGWGQERNMADWSDWLVFDILGELCYARSFGIKEPGENKLRGVPGFIQDYVTTMYPIANSPFADPWIWLKPRGLDKLLDMSLPKNVKAYFNFIEECLKERIKEEQAVQSGKVDPDKVRKDMFHYIFQSKDPETGNMGYRHEELFCESDLLIIAGSDTTSTVFAAMFFYLTRNPRVYDKLMTEIRTTFTNAEEIRSGAKLTSCRYLRAFIDEALRMNPPVPAELARETLAGGMHIDGRYIPQGLNVGVSAWALHRNGEAWPDAFTFNPERWEKVGTAHADAAFAPFSSGARGCPGKQLAYLEMTITMATVLFLADVRAVEGNNLGGGSVELEEWRREKEQFQLWDHFVASRKGPLVQFKARNV